MARLDALKSFTDVPGQIHRLFLSPAHRRAAVAVAEMMQDVGCDSVSIDALGTVVGRYEGREPGRPALLLGSHIDTVKDAGAYDGTLGVVAGLGVVEALREAGDRLPFAVELLAFGDEENVRFPTNLTSSRAVAGTFDPLALAARDEDGVSVGEALIAWGGNPDGIAAIARRPADVLGYLEVHIEQGPVLEAEGLPVGIVTAINASSRRRLTVTGEAGHAGTVPMALRKDALAAAAEMTLAVERAASEQETVATVGRLLAEPGAINVIPGKVSFSLDARAPRDETCRRLVDSITRECMAIARRRGVGLTIEFVADVAACPCDDRLRRTLGEAIAQLQLPVRSLPSGAGHDAMAMAALCPVGMLFVRCAGGISHNPAESITEDDADVAIRILLEAVRSYRPA